VELGLADRIVGEGRRAVVGLVTRSFLTRRIKYLLGGMCRTRCGSTVGKVFSAYGGTGKQETSDLAVITRNYSNSSLRPVELPASAERVRYCTAVREAAC
jgi:hypothetical protein